MINNKLLGTFEGQESDYATSPADRERLLQYLMGQGEMWNYFSCFVIYQHDPNGFDHEEISKHLIPWFFLPPPDSAIPRWLFLLQEWLELKETRERFGVEDCPHYENGRYTENCRYDTEYPCTKCDGSGKVKAEWVRGE